MRIGEGPGRPPRWRAPRPLTYPRKPTLFDSRCHEFPDRAYVLVAGEIADAPVEVDDECATDRFLGDRLAVGGTALLQQCKVDVPVRAGERPPAHLHIGVSND